MLKYFQHTLLLAVKSNEMMHVSSKEDRVMLLRTSLAHLRFALNDVGRCRFPII